MHIEYPLANTLTLTTEEVQAAFETNPDAGLTAAEATARNQEFGKNIYHAQKQKSAWLILLTQFKSPIVYLLVVGVAVSAFFQEYIEAVAIAAVIFINAAIGFLMEMQARSSMNALKEMEVSMTKVIRDQTIQEIPAEDLTPGDVLVLEAGDVIPGDGRLISTNHLQCDESSLTGESLPTEKNTDPLPEETPLGDRLNMVFKGTSVMNGNGHAIVTGISADTQLGTITALVESAKDTATPLDKKLNILTRKLIWVTLAMTAIFTTTGFLQGKSWVLIIETSIALAVAAIPEGLPIVATVALAYGMVLMGRKNALVKKLSSVETLGSTSVILTDKTGTLTENKIVVDTLAFPGGQVHVKIKDKALTFTPELGENQENFEKLRLIGALCNDASTLLEGDEKKPTGDPIEIALVRLTNASGPAQEEVKKQYPRIGEVPFSSEAKIMGTLHQGPEGQFVAAKGAVKPLLQLCTHIQSGADVTPLDEENKKAILDSSEAMAASGLRVLAFASNTNDVDPNDFLQSLVYVGMIGFLDPPRLDIRDAIVSCRKAGIQVVMITGDHPLTALNIAKKTGLVEEDAQNVITGSDLPDMDDLTDEWREKILATSVFARTTPKQKLDLADVFQKAGNIVAMTGDGVNDAPALKKADVGIAMGLRGTQVAKETASIILKDDSFTSIAEAVAHGREIFQNIQKFVVYLVSCNLSEILIVTTLGFLAPAATLLPLQILFLNMVTDIFPALALGVGKGDPTVMDRPPRNPEKGIVTKRDWLTITIYALLMTLAVIASVVYSKFVLKTDDTVANNVGFVTLVLAQLFHVFNMASPHSKLWINEVTRNKFVWMALVLCIGLVALVYMVPYLRLVMHLVVLPQSVWGVSLLASLAPLVLVQAYKAIHRAMHPEG